MWFLNNNVYYYVLALGLVPTGGLGHYRNIKQ